MEFNRKYIFKNIFAPDKNVSKNKHGEKISFFRK